MLNFLFQILIAVALAVVSFLLMPRPKNDKPDSVKDLEDPVAQAGMPIPVVFGTKTVKGLNVVFFGDKSFQKEDIEV